jgi:hypothetical protein
VAVPAAAFAEDRFSAGRSQSVMYKALVVKATSLSVAAFFVASVSPTWNAAVTSTVTVPASRRRREDAGVPTVTASHATPPATAAEALSAATNAASVSSSGHAADGRVNDAETVTFAAAVTAESSQVSVDEGVHAAVTPGHGYPVRVKSSASAQLPPPLAGVSMLRVASQVPPTHVDVQSVWHENAVITQGTAGGARVRMAGRESERLRAFRRRRAGARRPPRSTCPNVSNARKEQSAREGFTHPREKKGPTAKKPRRRLARSSSGRAPQGGGVWASSSGARSGLKLGKHRAFCLYLHSLAHVDV